MGTLNLQPNSPRISLTRNITNAHTLEELKMQLGEFVSRLEDYLNTQIGIHFLTDNKRRPTLLPGDLVFDFTEHPEFATLQQWDGKKLIPLDLGGFGGFIDLIAQGIGSGTDASLFLRSDGAGHWVLAAGPVGPAGPTGPAGADGISAYQVAVNNGFVGTEADWLMSLVGPAGPTGPTGPTGATGSVWYNGSTVPSSGLGVDGDYYLRTSNGDVYFKSSGSWSVILNIIGPAGATGATGATGSPGPGFLYGSGIPSNSLGVDGQIYFDTIQGDIYYKVAGAWVFKPGNAHYFQGKGLDTSVISPSDGNILVYDATLFSGTGGWKVAAPSGGSFSSLDNETRARLNLAIL